MADIIINPAVGKIDFFAVKGDNVTNTLKLTGNTLLVTGPLSASSISTGGGGAFVTSVQPTSNFLSKFTGNSTIANSLVYDNGTNVGIGTTSPADKFHVIGNVRINGGDILNWSGQAFIQTLGNYDMFFRPNSTLQMILTGNGNLGIGSGFTNPLAKLHVTSATSGATLVRTDGTSGTLFSVIDDLSDSLMSVNNSAGLPVFEVFADDRIVGGQYGKNDFVVVNNKLGIGTNNPTAKLQVTSSASTPSAVFLGGNVGIGTTNPAGKLDVRGAIWANYGVNGLGYIQTNGSDSDLQITIATNLTTLMNTGGSAGLAFGSGNSERMRINSTGNVGIGTTSPAYKLDVNGVTRFQDVIRLKNAGWNLTDDGQVRFYFDVNGRTYFGSGNGYEWRSQADSALMVLTNAGNVGIGSSSPAAKLDIVGTNSTIALSFGNTVPNNPLFINTYGSNTGIGMDQATAGLRLAGDYSGGTNPLVDVGYYSGGTVAHANWVSRFKVVNSGATVFTANVYHSIGSQRLFAGSGGGFNYIYTGTTALNFLNGADTSTLMTILNGGSVGIGTTSPTALLHVNGTTRFGSSTSSTQAITGSLNVTGSITLNTSKDSNWPFLISDPSTSGGNSRYQLGKVGAMGFNYADSYAQLQLIGANGAYIDFGNAAVDDMDARIFYVTNTRFQIEYGTTLALNSTGLGIGTTSPSNKTTIDADATGASFADNGVGQLVIRGATNTAKRLGLGIDTTNNIGVIQAQLYGTGQYPLVLNPAGGSVGIGTTSPITKFDVRSGYITTGTGTSTSGTIMMGGYYGDGNLTILGTEYSSGGPMLGYGVTPSTTSAGAFLSSTGVNVYRSAYVQDGGTHRWYIGAVQTVAIGSAVSASERMRINADGNLGIGTSSPLQILHVNGNILLDGVTNGYTQGATRGIGYGSNSGGVSTDGFSGMDIQSVSVGGNYSQNVRFWAHYYGTGTGNTPRMVIQYNGNVGISTTSPNAKLESYFSSNALTFNYLATNLNNSSPIPTYAFDVTNGSTETRAIKGGIGFERWNPNGGGSLHFYNNNANDSTNISGTRNSPGYIRMSIDYSGNIGIGTTVPDRKLDVSGSAIRSFITAGSVEPGFIVDYPRSNGYGAFFIHVNGSRRWRIGSVGDTNNQPALNFWQEGTGSRMMIINNGNVGIGTTSPGSLLQVGGSSGATATPTAITFDNTYRNAVGGNTSLKIYLYKSGGETYGFGLNNAAGIEYHAGSSGGSTANHAFYTETTEKVRINSAGNLGIGTTAPAYKLDVNGTGRFANDLYTNGNIVIARAGAYLYINGTNSDAEIVWQTNGGNRWAMGMNVGDATENLNIYNYTTSTTNFTILKANGNVGIGSTAPAYKLHVVGTGFASSDFRAPIFYDSDNTNFYVDPASTSVLNTLASNVNVPNDSNTGGDLYAADIAISAYHHGDALNYDAFQFNAPNTYETKATSGAAWVSTSVETSIFRGDTSGTLDIANGTYQVRWTWNTIGYRYFKSLYAMVSTRDNYFTLTIEHSANGSTWTTLGTTGGMGGWPGHDWFHSKWNNATTQAYLRITLTPVWNSASYAISIYSLRYFCTYPLNAGSRLFTWDYDKTFYFQGKSVAIGGSNAYTANNRANLELYGSTDSLIALKNASGNSYIQKFSNDLYINNVTNGALAFFNVNTERMRIDSNGNVGIGTSSPTSLLNIRASAPTGTGTVTTGTNVLIDSNTNNYITFRNTLDNGTYAGLVFLDNNIGGYVAFRNYTGEGVIAGSDCMIYGSIQDHIFQNGYVNETLYNRPETMRIKSNGYVGINTNNPTGRLHIVQGNSGGVAAILLSTDESTIQGPSANTQIRMGSNLVLNASNVMPFNVNASETMRIINNGNIGIGTTTPLGKLHVYGLLRVGGAANEQTGLIALGNDANAVGTYADNGIFRGGIGSLGSANYTNIGSYQGIVFNVQNAQLGSQATRMIIDVNGNVGIGTTGPGAKLDVNGDIYARSGYGVYSNIIAPYTGDLTFYTGGTEKMRILSSGGNVGIGTTSPTAKLTVSSNLFLLGINAQRQYTYYAIGSANDDFYFRSSTSFANQGANFSMNLSRLTYQSAGSGNDLTDKVGVWLRGFYDNSGGGLPIYLGGYAYSSQIPAVTITGLNADGGGGSLGIGTTAPNAKLQVNSTTSGATLVRADGTSGTLFSVIDDLSDSLMSVNNSAGLPVFEVFADDRIVGGQYGRNDFVVVNNKVGIGTNNPIGKLHVTGSSTTPAALFFGNVGIGTTSFLYPTATRGLLEIYGSADSIIALKHASTHAYFHKASNDFYLVNGGAGTISIYNNGSERMQINSSGNIGIGTSSPTALLHVNGGTILGTSGPTLSFNGNTCTAASYNYVMGASNDGGNKLVIFVNGSARTDDGGVNALTIRNDGGPFVLGQASYLTSILGSSVTINSNVALHAGNYTSYAVGLTTNNTITGINTQYNETNTFVNNVTHGNRALTLYQPTAGADAYMTFHVGGDFAGYFGLGGAENDLVWGGWSVGDVRYRILHSGNASYAWNMNQNVRTSDTCSFAAVTATTFTGALAGNATTATNLSTNRTNWSTNGTITAVVGQLSWKNYGNGHTIIDASNATSPAGGAINNTNPDVAWTGTYPTLMGWNGSNTYGVRVDSSRYADNVSYAPSRTDSTAYPVLWGAGTSWTIAYSCAAVTIQSSTGTLTATTFSGAGTGLTGTAASLNVGGTAGSISGFNNPATAATASTIAYRDSNADLTTRYFLANRTSAGASQCGIQLQTGGTTKWWMYLRQSDDNVLAFYTSNATADDIVRMTSTGLGIKVDPSNRLHINGDNTNPAIRIDNGAIDTTTTSGGRTFYGWLPISIAGTTRWIRLFN